MHRTDPNILYAQLIARNLPGRSGEAALLDAAGSVNYEEFNRIVLTLCIGLSTAGVTKGDNVMLVFPNCVEQVVSVLAVSMLGACAVPAAESESRDRVEYIRTVTRPRVILTRQPEPYQENLVVNVDMEAKRLLQPSVAGSGQDAESLPAGTPDSPALILFSSGSTGRPKGVVLEHRHLLFITRSICDVYGFAPGHREYIICPLSHSDGWDRVSATLYSGGCVILSEERVSVHGLLEDLGKHRVTGFFTPPPLIRTLLKMDAERARESLTSCRSVEIGSAPITQGELDAFMSLLPQSGVFLHYGLTESSRASMLDTRKYPSKLNTVGCAGPGVGIEIRKEGGANCSVGETGQIYLCGPQQAEMYWENPRDTKDRFLQGWLSTGDYGFLDEEGFLSYVGRRDDLITSSGYHFFPAEVETELGPVEGIREYLIAGVKDPRGVLEQVVWAFIVPVHDREDPKRSFLAKARDSLSQHMAPKWVVVVPDLPLTASGKPDRRKCVQLYGPEA